MHPRSDQGGFHRLASYAVASTGGFLTKIVKSTLPESSGGVTICYYRHLMPYAPRGGFQVDSPVNKPSASEMPRCAPPHTFGAREEPCQGGPLSVRPSNLPSVGFWEMLEQEATRLVLVCPCLPQGTSGRIGGGDQSVHLILPFLLRACAELSIGAGPDIILNY